MSTYHEIVVTLAAARRSQKLSLDDVGQAAGTGSTCINGWERGERMLGLARAIDWAEALGYELRLVRREAP